MKKVSHDQYRLAVRKLLRRAYRSEGARGSARISPGEELRKVIEQRRKSPRTIPNDIELWLVFFDEAIAFWFEVWGDYRLGVSGPTDKLIICLMALSGRVFQDLVCIREMITGGFAVQANVVARSLIEEIDVMHLLNSNPSLSDEFRGIVENSDSSKFWHKYCSGDKIHKVVRSRWSWFFENNEDAAESFHGQRESYLDLTGMSVHPSFAASFVTFMDSNHSGADQLFDIALGTVSHLSKFTMHLILLRVFEYGILWTGPKIGLHRSEPNKEQPPLYDRISKGLSVLLSIVKEMDSRPTNDPFFPEFQTYWPRPTE